MDRLVLLLEAAVPVPERWDGCEVCVLGPEATAEERLAAIARAQIVIGEPSETELAAAKELRWVQMTWAGAERYQDGHFPRNVLLTTASGAFGQTIAEHALGMLLALCRRLPAYGRRADWEDLGSEKSLSGATALIFGCGDIGSAIARRLKPFGVKTLGVCRRPERCREDFDGLTDLAHAPDYFDRAELILCALPHAEETAGYFDRDRLSKLRDDAVLVNVGRGSFLDTAALTELLQQGKFFGVGLDVTQPEPLPPEHPLWTLPNVILTPHVAGVGLGHLPETTEKIWEICRENLRRYQRGEALRNLVKLP